MEYLLGSFITFMSIIFVGLRLPRIKNSEEKIKYSQSHIYSLVKPLLDLHPQAKARITTQASKYEDKTNVKVIIIEGSAYWVKDNLFYTAPFDINGIDKESAQVVDTMNMDKVELDKMIFIIDQLRDGKKNDSGSTGNK
jgi:hypothetical protein